jgi:CPA2 family monovalent cation:H+ antiporter-2
VVQLRRMSGAAVPVNDEAVLQDGDTVVLSGRAEALTLAEGRLLRG